MRTRHLSNKVGSLWSYTRLPHCVTTVSDHVRQHLIDRGVPPDRVATVYSPIAAAARGAFHAARRAGLAQDDVVVGCVAVMRATKGHKDLIDAIAPLMASRPKLHLVFVGGGSPVFEQTQEYVAQLGLQDRIHLMGMRRDVPNLLAGFDLFALATQQEASGTVYVEAQASGCPWSARTWAACPRCSATARPASWCRPGSGGAGRRADAIDRRSGAAPRHGRGRPQAGLGRGRVLAVRLAETTEAVYGKWLAERGK